MGRRIKTGGLETLAVVLEHPHSNNTAETIVTGTAIAVQPFTTQTTNRNPIPHLVEIIVGGLILRQVGSRSAERIVLQ
jgi:outer membrane lipoprotein SlyB